MDETPSRLAATPPPAAKDQAPPWSAGGAPGIPSFETMDRLGRAVTARLTQGISPHALYDAWFDWASHLANAPGRLIELGVEAVNIGARFARFATQSLSEHTKAPFEPQAGDRRFSDLSGSGFLTRCGSRRFSRRKRGGRAPRARSAA